MKTTTLPMASVVLLLSTLATAAPPTTTTIVSQPPVAIEAHQLFDYSIELDPPSEMNGATFQILAAPAGAFLISDGQVSWQAGDAGPTPHTFEIEIVTASGATLLESFDVLVADHFPPGENAVIASYGLDQPMDMLQAGGVATTQTLDGAAACPPGSFDPAAGGDACADRANAFQVREWAMVFRPCAEGACLPEARYLQLELTAHLAGGGGGGDQAAPRAIVYVTRDWNRGRPVWDPVGAAELSAQPELVSDLVWNLDGVQGVLIAREHAVGAPIAFSGLDLMEADDLHLRLLPREDVSEAGWFLGSHGLVPSADDPVLGGRAARRALRAEMELLGLRSRFEAGSGIADGLHIVARADEQMIIESLPLVAESTLDRSPLPVSDLADARQQIHADDANAIYGATGAGVTVAVADSGVQTNHPFLGGKASQFCRRSGNRFLSCNIPCGADVENVSGPYCEHGTHVAGVVAGVPGVNGSHQGIAPDADLLSFPNRAMSVGRITLEIQDRVLAGRRIAALNMSFNPHEYFTTTQNGSAQGNDFLSYQRLWRLGTAPVRSAGNLPDASCIWPLNYYKVGTGARESNVVRVSGVNGSNDFHCSSKTAPIVELAAVGQGVTSSTLNGGFGSKNGTSFAAPMVSAAFAALTSMRPECAPETILEVLRSTGQPIRETRGGQDFTIPRIHVASAAGQLLLRTCKPAAPDTVRVGDRTRETAAVTFMDRASNEDGFEVQAVAQRAPWIDRTVDFPPNRTGEAATPTPLQMRADVLLDGLEAGGRYCVRVRAYRVDGGQRVYSDWAESQDSSGQCADVDTLPLLVPGAPDQITVTARTLTTLSFEWTDSSATPPGAPPVTHSMVTLLGSGLRSTGAVHTWPGQTSAGNLGANAPYDIYVRLCNVDGCGPAKHRRAYTGPTSANPATADTDANTPGAAPLPPTNLRAEVFEEDHARLTWDEPSDHVDYYELLRIAPPAGPSPGAASYREFSSLEEARLVLAEPRLAINPTIYQPSYNLRRCIRGGRRGSQFSSCSPYSDIAVWQ